MRAVEKLHALIEAVAPINGISASTVDGKVTMAVDFAANATKAQKTAAAAIVSSFVYDDRDTSITAADFLARFTPAEWTALCAALSTRPAILGQLILWAAGGKIDLAAAATKTRLDVMVTAGIITVAREAEILALPPPPLAPTPSPTPQPPPEPISIEAPPPVVARSVKAKK